MSVAFYIVLDNEEPGFETVVNGKALALESKKLDAISQSLGVPTFEDFISMSADDIADMLGDDIDILEQDIKWFTADEGIVFIKTMADHIRANPMVVKNPKAILYDLEEYAEIFEKAKGIGARWHLNLDI